MQNVLANEFRERKGNLTVLFIIVNLHFLPSDLVIMLITIYGNFRYQLVYLK